MGEFRVFWVNLGDLLAKLCGRLAVCRSRIGTFLPKNNPGNTDGLPEIQKRIRGTMSSQMKRQI